jgi:hypothetical protein
MIALAPKCHPYEDIKKLEQQALIQQIEQTEASLVNLYLHKKLIEADFAELLLSYQNLIKKKIPFSKELYRQLIEYFSFELLKPLPILRFESNESYSIWRMKHFVVLSQVNEQQDLVFSLSFDINAPSDELSYLPLLVIKPAEMLVEINEDQILRLINLWYGIKMLSTEQLSFINADLNILLDYFRKLGFANQPSLLDQSCMLNQELYLANGVEAKVLDAIFIATMETDEYDFDKIDTYVYRVSLAQGLNFEINNYLEKTKVKLHSNKCRGSILDFVIRYSFLVPLIVESSYQNEVD